MTLDQQIRRLEKNIEELRQRQIDHSNELFALRSELIRITLLTKQSIESSENEDRRIDDAPQQQETQPKQVNVSYPDYSSKSTKSQPKVTLDVEKYIGENIISKVGIVATLIGIGIGVKYSIDNNLITPLMRVLLAYGAGLGLGAFAYRLQEKYKHLSALLFGGSVATVYFVTFAAYDFYNLIPLTIASLIMLCCTVFTMAVSVRYQQQPIAILGLIGAYALPPLLSTGNNSMLFLSYMTLVNLGALFLTVRQRWWSLLYSTVAGTWLIYALWMFESQELHDIIIGISYSSIWFMLIQTSLYLLRDISDNDKRIFFHILNIANAIAYYYLNYILLTPEYEQLTGAFTLACACFHGVLFVWIYKFSARTTANNPLLFSSAGLSVLFLTLAIPVEFDGNWVTLLWAGEATLGIYMALRFAALQVRYVSYVLLFLSLGSLIGDIQEVHQMFTPSSPETKITAFFNIYFTTYIFVITSFLFTSYLFYRDKLFVHNIEKIALFSLTALIGYGVIASEISLFWSQLMSEVIYLEELRLVSSISSYRPLEELWLLNFSLFYWGILSILVRRLIENKQIGIISVALNLLLLFIFCITTISSNIELLFMETPLKPLVSPLLLFHSARYFSFFIAVINLFSIYQHSRGTKTGFLQPYADTASHIVMLCITSSIMIQWANTYGSVEFIKTFGLTILWGVYALSMIFWGIRLQYKHIRIAAIVLLGVTVLKLLFDDLADLETIAKTFLFIIIGLLLLVVSFLYNKYRNTLAKDDSTSE